MRLKQGILTGTVVAIIAIAVFAGSATAGQIHNYTGTSFGPDGTAGSTFPRASALAIDQSEEILYVAVTEDGAIEKFTLGGTSTDFSATPGSNAIPGIGFRGGTGESQIAVDQGSGNIYATSGNSILAFAPSGAPLNFSAGTNPGTNEISGFGELLGVAVDAEGNIYAGDYGNGGVVSVYAPSGELLTSFESTEAGNLAVDNVGSVYVNPYHGGVKRYVPDLLPVTAATTFSETETVDPGPAYSVAVDPASNDLYVDLGNAVAQYDEAGEKLGELAAGGPGSVTESTGVAVAGASGQVFVSDRAGPKQVAIFGPGITVPTVETSPPASHTDTTAVFAGKVNPSGEAVQECFFEYGETTAYGQTATCEDPDAGELGTGTSPVEVQAEISGLTPGTEFHYRLVAANGNGTSRGADTSFFTAGPIISAQHVITVQPDGATVQAAIDPTGSPTTYRVEYGLSTAYGQATESQSAGAGVGPETVTAAIGALAPGTTYHFRFVATNAEGSSAGEDKTFTTSSDAAESGEGCPNAAFRIGASARLANCRAYELVSPVDKNNIDIKSLFNFNGSLNLLDQSSADGESFTYTTSQGFGDSEGVPFVSQYLAERSGSGWGSRGLSTPQGVASSEPGNRLDLEYAAFTPDLCTGILRNDTLLALAPGAIPNSENLYLRQSCAGGGLEALGVGSRPDLAGPTAGYRPEVQGFSADGRCAVYQYMGAFVERLWEVCAGQAPIQIGLLPDGSESPLNAAAGTTNTSVGVRTENVLGAMSADGSKVYWTAKEAGEGSLNLRLNADKPQSVMAGSECTEADMGCTVAVESGASHFWSASPDGNTAIYSTGGSNGSVGGELRSFSAPSEESEKIAGGFLGIVGASTDARQVAFASTEALTAEANSEGAVASAGKPNLYLYDATAGGGAGGFRFIATIAARDAVTLAQFTYTTVAAEPYKHVSRISDGGDGVAFMSHAQLTGYDNSDPQSGEQVAEVYVYSADGTLACVSCNPTGQAPAGKFVPLESEAEAFYAAGFLAPFQTQLHGANVISADGTRVFFESFEALVPADVNATTDVYEWEAPGTSAAAGKCTVDSPSFRPVNSGCITLISSGEGPIPAEFLDASPSGRDVFFSTSTSLLPQDPGLVDIYDAREGGGFPLQPLPPDGCTGAACQMAGAPPAGAAPQTGVARAGNPKQRCGHGRRAVKRRGKTRCVKRHKKQAGKAKSRSAKGGPNAKQKQSQGDVR
jgi:hypothetical protein